MALTSHQLWKTLTSGSGNMQIAWVDFNPRFLYTPTWLTNLASTYDLTWYQYGHEVICAEWVWNESWWHFITFRKWSTELFSKYTTWNAWYFAYIGIDYDEIMANWTDYYVDFWIFSYTSDEWWFSFAADWWNNCWTYLAPIFDANVNAWDTIIIWFYDWISPAAPVLKWVTISVTITSKVYRDANWYTYYHNWTNPTAAPWAQLLCFMYKWKSVQASDNFSVTNFPSVTEASGQGYIWVEWDNIWFVDAVKSSTWYKHKIKHDWSTYGTATGKEWAYWVEQTHNWQLWYVDSSGYIRRTYVANDWAWTNTWWWTELPLSWKTPGMIWVSGPWSQVNWSYGYLIFIWYDGKGYRIMNWPV